MSEKKDPGDFTGCPNWGKGGRFVVDPSTGKRVPAVEEETALATSDASAATAADAEATAVQPTKSVKETRRA